MAQPGWCEEYQWSIFQEQSRGVEVEYQLYNNHFSAEMAIGEDYWCWGQRCCD